MRIVEYEKTKVIFIAGGMRAGGAGALTEDSAGSYLIARGCQ